MSVSTCHCPNCGVMLKLAGPIPAGNKVKCPKCGTIFGMIAEGSVSAAAVPPSPPSAVVPRKAAHGEQDQERDGHPRHEGSRLSHASVEGAGSPNEVPGPAKPEGPFFDLFLYRRGAAYGFFVLALLVILCGVQLAPGWQLVDLGWGKGVYFGIIGVCGAVTGFLGAKCRVAGLIGSAVAGLGGLSTIAFVLSWVPVMPKIVLVMVMCLGFVPGVGIYWVLDKALAQSGGR